MTHYLIEFRFRGAAKREIKRLIYEINRKFKVRSKKRAIPHVTIIAPFMTKNQRRLVIDFKEICRKYDKFNFKIKGYGYFANSKVVYINIIPSQGLLNFRNDLMDKLKEYCNLNRTDLSSIFGFKRKKEYCPHATLAMKLDLKKFNLIRAYINKKKEISKKFIVVRATLIKNNKILYEYDFILKRLLNRRQAKSRRTYLGTIKRLKNG